MVINNILFFDNHGLLEFNRVQDEFYKKKFDVFISITFSEGCCNDITDGTSEELLDFFKSNNIKPYFLISYGNEYFNRDEVKKNNVKILPPDMSDLFVWPTSQLCWLESWMQGDHKNYQKQIDNPKNGINKLFINLNHRNNRNRFAIMDFLTKYELIDLGINSWHRFDGYIRGGIKPKYWQPQFYKFDTFIGTILNREGKMGSINAFGHEIVSEKFINHDALVHIVNESENDYIRYTEKTWFPILMGRPFMILGRVGCNQRLCDFGFKLYDELFDYSFDDIDDCELRAEEIVLNLNRIKNQDYNQIYDRIKDKVFYNRRNAEKLIQNVSHVERQFFDNIEIFAPTIRKDFETFLQRRFEHITINMNMEKIILALEEWDSIFNYYRPNASSKTWGLKELGELITPPTIPPWILFDQQLILDLDSLEQNITPSFGPNVEYVEYELIDNHEKFIYFIDVKHNDFFYLNDRLGFRGISEKYKKAAREGRCKIVLHLPHEGISGSSVGSHKNHFLLIDEWCDISEIPHSCVYFLTGNLKGRELAKRFGIRSNIVPFCETITFNNVMEQPTGIVDFKPIDEKCLYLTYSRRPRYHRLLFTLNLIKENLHNDGKWSFNFLDDSIPQPKHFGDEFVDEITFLRENQPFFVDVDNTNNADVDKHINFKNYEQTFISVVGETEHDKDILFLSEKIWKPIIVGHPFIVNGNANTLKYLRDIGYMTFDRWIDESYDDEIDTNKRVSMIIEEIKKLKSMSISELFKIRKEMAEVCAHNKKHLIKETIRRCHYFGDYHHHLIQQTELEKIWGMPWDITHKPKRII